MGKQLSIFALIFLSFSINTKAQLINAMEMSFTQLINPNFTFATPLDYENGKIITGSASISILSDQDWVLEISSGGSSFWNTNNGEQMPVSDLSVKPTLNTTWVPLSTSNQTLTSGLSTYYLDGTLNIQGTGDGNGNCDGLNTLLITVPVPCSIFTIDYKVELSDFYDGGTYTTVVYYTLSAQ